MMYILAAYTLTLLIAAAVGIITAIAIETAALITHKKHQ